MQFKKHKRGVAWLSSLALFAVLAIAVVIWKPLGENTVLIQFEDSYMSLSDENRVFYREIPYADVVDVSYTMVREYGSSSDSIQDGSCLFGTFSNDQWQQYMLYVNTNVKYAIVVQDRNENFFVFNCGNEHVTKETAEALQELIFHS